VAPPSRFGKTSLQNGRDCVPRAVRRLFVLWAIVPAAMWARVISFFSRTSQSEANGMKFAIFNNKRPAGYQISSVPTLSDEKRAHCRGDSTLADRTGENSESQSERFRAGRRSQAQFENPGIVRVDAEELANPTGVDPVAPEYGGHNSEHSLSQQLQLVKDRKTRGTSIPSMQFS
jgi:hypothetical protein